MCYGCAAPVKEFDFLVFVVGETEGAEALLGSGVSVMFSGIVEGGWTYSDTRRGLLEDELNSYILLNCSLDFYPLRRSSLLGVRLLLQ